MNFRSVIGLASVMAVLAAAMAGCGDEGPSGPAGLAPPGSVLYVEGLLRPEGELRSNADSLAKRITGAESLRDFVVEELESWAEEDGRSLDFAAEVEPWLGERAGVFFRHFDGEDFRRGAAIVETTDSEAAREFAERQADAGEEPGRAFGVVGDFLVVAEDPGAFEQAVDAAEGRSLAEDRRFQRAMSGAVEGSLADAFLDLGRIVGQSGGGIDDRALSLLRSAGIEPGTATAVASLLPRRERIELELSSDLGGEEAPRGDASELLGSLPAGAFAAFAVSGFGDQLQEAIDSLDAAGIPGEVPPGRLKSLIERQGFDVERLIGSLGEAGVFAEGGSEASLRGALVVDVGDPRQAANTVRNLGLLLRLDGEPGVTAVRRGGARGFSIRDEELGREPVVVLAAGGRIAVGYGTAAALRGVAGRVRPLAATAAFQEAEAALGGIPISAFVDGPGALRLAEAMVPRSETGFWKARPYLRSIRSLALGSRAEGERATAKLVVSLR